MSDLIERQAAIDVERNATVDTNPSHFEAHQKFTQFMDDAEISSFGRWQWSNGFNTALTAVGIDLKKLPSAQPEPLPTASPWHRVEEKPKEGTWCVIAKHSYLKPHNLFYDIAHYLHGTFSVYDSGEGDWFDGKPLYWMPIEPPKKAKRRNPI